MIIEERGSTMLWQGDERFSILFYSHQGDRREIRLLHLLESSLVPTIKLTDRSAVKVRLRRSLGLVCLLRRPSDRTLHEVGNPARRE